MVDKAREGRKRQEIWSRQLSRHLMARYADYLRRIRRVSNEWYHC
jgi:hypothetical protein